MAEEEKKKKVKENTQVKGFGDAEITLKLDGEEI